MVAVGRLAKKEEKEPKTKNKTKKANKYTPIRIWLGLSPHFHIHNAICYSRPICMRVKATVLNIRTSTIGQEGKQNRKKRTVSIVRKLANGICYWILLAVAPNRRTGVQHKDDTYTFIHIHASIMYEAKRKRARALYKPSP